MATAEELQNKRIDGVRGKVAPFLRGYGHWPDTNSQIAHAENFYQCVEALLGDIPFWFKVTNRSEFELMHPVLLSVTYSFPKLSER